MKTLPYAVIVEFNHTLTYAIYVVDATSIMDAIEIVLEDDTVAHRMLVAFKNQTPASITCCAPTQAQLDKHRDRSWSTGEFEPVYDGPIEQNTTCQLYGIGGVA